jgi:hypothetical protein
MAEEMDDADLARGLKDLLQDPAAMQKAEERIAKDQRATERALTAIADATGLRYDELMSAQCNLVNGQYDDASDRFQVQTGDGWVDAESAPEFWRQAVARLRELRASAKPDVKIGDQVNIKYGPFAGFVGTIREYDQTGHALVEVEFLGRPTPVKLEHWFFAAV